MSKELPNIGEKIVVHGMIGYEAKVSSLKWDDTFFDWIIELDWGKWGVSRVKLHDYNKVWYRISETN